MARSFDTWLRYQDNQSKPLRGCVQFMVRDGNTSAPIYDQDGEELDNPQITDVYGRTEHQVFINEDVTAYFYKYIGQGTLEQEQELGIDTNDPSKWSLQYTCENQASYDTHLTANAPTCVPSISALRALDVDEVPTTCDKIEITLLGYNAVGDKEPINYTWVSGSTEADNGGSVIKCDDLITGRWIMTQPTEHVDSRHFGAFPQNSYNCPDQSYMIGQLCVYCMLHGLRPFFNGSMDYRWFKYNNLSIVVDAIDVTEDTRFYDMGNNTFQCEWNGNPRFTLGNTNVTAKNIKTSWNAKSYTGYKNVIIDAQTTQKNWQDAHIDVQLNTLYGYNFTNCSFELNGHLGSDNVNEVDNTFNNCKLNEKMFILSGANAANLINCCTNCQYDIDDFKNALYLYKQIRCTSDANPYFDYQGLAPGLPFSMYTGNKITSTACEVHNMKNPITELDVIALGSQLDTIILDDCTGYYAFNARTVYIRNSNIKLAMTSATTFIIENSTVVLDANNVTTAMQLSDAPTMSLRSSVLLGETNVTYNFSNFSSFASIIHPAINSGNTVLKDSQINGIFSLIPEAGIARTVNFNNAPTEVSHFLHGFIQNNIFNNTLRFDGAAVHDWYPTVDHVLAENVVIENNRSNYDTLPFEVERWGTMYSDNLNTYSWVNNTGAFECKVTVSATIGINSSSGSWDQNAHGMLLENMLQSYLGALSIARNTSNTSTPYYEDDDTRYFCEMRLFTMGQYDACVNLDIVMKPLNPIDSHINCYHMGGPNKVMAALDTNRHGVPGPSQYTCQDIKHIGVDGYTWQIRNFCFGISYFDDGERVYVTLRQADRPMSTSVLG